MHVSLSTELESRIKSKMETGLYKDANEVIGEALHFMDTHEVLVREHKLARLREEIKIGTDQLDRGEGIKIESKADLKALFEDIMA